MGRHRRSESTFHSRFAVKKYYIDFSHRVGNNQDMDTTEKITDKDALLDRITTGKPLDPEVYRRIREEGKRITDELRRTHGEMDIAVELIREVRDES